MGKIQIPIIRIQAIWIKSKTLAALREGGREGVGEEVEGGRGEGGREGGREMEEGREG